MDGWLALLLALGGLACFVLILFGALFMAGDILRRDPFRPRRTRRRPPRP